MFQDFPAVVFLKRFSDSGKYLCAADWKACKGPDIVVVETNCFSDSAGYTASSVFGCRWSTLGRTGGGCPCIYIGGSHHYIWNEGIEDKGGISCEKDYYNRKRIRQWRTWDWITNLAEKEPCIIVGRCADYILKDHKNRISFFITADEKKKIARIKNKYGVTEAEAVKMINKNDRNRRNYYKSITGKTWGMAENYDFCICSSYYGIDSTVEIITGLLQ